MIAPFSCLPQPSVPRSTQEDKGGHAIGVRDISVALITLFKEHLLVILHFISIICPPDYCLVSSANHFNFMFHLIRNDDMYENNMNTADEKVCCGSVGSMDWKVD